MPSGREAGTGRARRISVGALYVLLGAIALVEVGRDLASPGDYDRFIAFGKAALARQIPYDPAVEHSYIAAHWATWPPSFAPIAAVLARLDALAHEPAVFFFQLLNLVALAWMMAVLARWLYGRKLTLGIPPARSPAASGTSVSGTPLSDTPVPGGAIPLAALPMLGALLVPLRMVLSNFEHAQSNLVILALAVGGMWLFRKGRRVAGGLVLGLSTAFKATPLLLLLYLAWRGRWKDLGSAIAGCVLLWFVVPALLLGPSLTVQWYAAWRARSESAVKEIAPLNQSLLALLQRYFPGIPAWPVFLALGVLLGLLALVAFGRPGRPVSALREALEVGVVLAGMSILSPLSWKAHYVTLVPLSAALLAVTPSGLRWRRTREEAAAQALAAPGAGGGRPAWLWQPRILYGILGLAFVALNVTSHGILGRSEGLVFEAGGVVTLSALLLVGTALVLLLRGRRSGTLTGEAGGG